MYQAICMKRSSVVSGSKLTHDMPTTSVTIITGLPRAQGHFQLPRLPRHFKLLRPSPLFSEQPLLTLPVLVRDGFSLNSLTVVPFFVFALWRVYPLSTTYGLTMFRTGNR
ncbi:hypothetical protein TNCV_4429891 [Trichonephila clavipes]|nr:hypothetical protein TNCV_4429891 [Trichonephila clavipes]